MPMMQYKFVSGSADDKHEQDLNATATQGYIVKVVTADPSPYAFAQNKPIVVLMEKQIS